MADSPRTARESVGGDHADYRRTVRAVVAGWVVPGLGHVLLGRVRRGLLFAAIIWGAYALGLGHDGRLALRDPRQPFLTTLQVVANLGIGPADAIARWGVYGRPVYTLDGRPSLDGNPTPQTIFRQRARSAVSIYGTAYLWTAGLMNLLLLFDIWDIGLRRKW